MLTRSSTPTSVISYGREGSSNFDLRITSGATREYVMGDFYEFLSDAKSVFDKRFGFKMPPSNISLKDFDIIRTIGTGTFSQVVLVRFREANTFHALKVMQKEQIVSMKAINYILNEKKVLEALSFPFCVYLQHSFQDNCNLYLGMPFINGGEIYTHLRQQERFSEDIASFYVAQLVLCLEYLHYMGLIYRDLKPENVLLDSMGFIRLTDFGFCKRVTGRSYTFCGTPEYIAPEIILNKGHGPAVDWWALGVLTFELNAGYPPFQAAEPLKLYEKISSGKFSIPPDFSKELYSLITCLLEKDTTRRYGTLKNGVEDIKSHAWFQKINWTRILDKTQEPPFSPTTKGRGDSSNFDEYDETVIPSSDKDPYERYFENF